MFSSETIVAWNRTPFSRVLIAIVAFLAFMPVLACTSDATIEREIEDVAPSEIVGPVTAKQLLDDYEANAIRAQQLYEGKVIIVAGVVDSIGEDLLGDPFVSLTFGSEFSFRRVQCFFADSHRDELATLSKGDIVALQGRGDGFLVNALVRGCRVVAVQ